MAAKKIIKAVIIAAILIFLAALFFAGRFFYITRYKITDIDTSVSEDGNYFLAYQNVGEPDWPFGASRVRLVLRGGKKNIIRFPFEIRNDGKWPAPEQWRVDWKEDRVEVTVFGEEQADMQYILYFNGTVRSGESGGN